MEDENKYLKDENAEFKMRLSQIAIDHESETTKLRGQVSELESQLKTLELAQKSSPEIPDSLSQTKLMAELEDENLKLQKVCFFVYYMYNLYIADFTENIIL